MERTDRPLTADERDALEQYAEGSCIQIRKVAADSKESLPWMILGTTIALVTLASAFWVGESVGGIVCFATLPTLCALVTGWVSWSMLGDIRNADERCDAARARAAADLARPTVPCLRFDIDRAVVFEEIPYDEDEAFPTGFAVIDGPDCYVFASYDEDVPTRVEVVRAPETDLRIATWSEDRIPAVATVAVPAETVEMNEEDPVAVYEHVDGRPVWTTGRDPFAD